MSWNEGQIEAVGTRQNYLTTQEAADILRVSSRSLERLRQTGGGPAFVRVGRRVVYDVSMVVSWAARHTFSSTSE